MLTSKKLPTVEVVPNDNEKEREDRHGRVRVSRRRAWVLLIDGEAWGEYRTKTLAEEAGARRVSAIVNKGVKQ